jgi:hypothetical protein
VCVHSLSAAEGLWLQAKLAEDVAKARRNADIAWTEEQADAELEARTLVWVAITACRTGEAPDSPRAFKPEHADTLRTSRGMLIALRAIGETVQRLGQTDTASERALRDFFDGMGSWAEKLCSGLSAESLPATHQALVRFVTYCGVMKQRAGLLPTDLPQTLRDL